MVPREDALWEQVLLRIILIPLAMAVLGLVWAPVAGASSGALAWRRKQPIGDAVGAGIAHSVALWLPWVFLMGRVAGLQTPFLVGRTVDVAMHLALYSLWAALYIAFLGYGGLSLITGDDAAIDPLNRVEALAWGVSLVAIGMLNVVTVGWCVRGTWKRYTKPVPKLADTGLPTVEESGYLIPWFSLLIWTGVVTLVSFFFLAHSFTT